MNDQKQAKKTRVMAMPIREVEIMEEHPSWMSTTDAAAYLRLSRNKVSTMCINLLQHPRPVKGKLRSYGFHFDSTMASVRIVQADVYRMLPTPKEFVERNRKQRPRAYAGHVRTQYSDLTEEEEASEETP